jgi:hypothetical protein
MPPFPAPPVIGGASGLPAYTMPPASSGGPPTYGTPPSHGAGHREPRTADASPRYGSTYGGPPSYGGVSAQPAPAHQAPAPNGTPVTTWTSTHGAAVPQQRGPGTVYGRTGGYPAIDMTMPVSAPLESSGSLTGHILAQGWTDTPAARKRGNLRVAVIMLVVLTAMIGVSLLVLFMAGDAMTKMFSGLL